MDLINSKLLQNLIEENKKEMEGLFPELIKRLIVSSCKKISSIRIPSLDDVWAPGFDGIISCDEQTTYVNSGDSVWEFGTNEDTLKKINADFEKRDKNALGINKPETSFYIVVPYVWAYNNQGFSISQWELSHKGEWKTVKVYDAPIICDWLNSEPGVCAWLFNQINREDFYDFSTVSSAWEKLCNYTNPPFSSSMFLSEREKEIDIFRERVNSPLCVVKADTLVGARGFALAALMQNEELAQTCIVVNNEKTYNSISSIVRDKHILLNFHFSGEMKLGNKLILCRNREGAAGNDEIELPLLTKSAYKKALLDMKISNADCEELFAFTHGNLRTLIRRIRGSYYEDKPDWETFENKDCLVPLVFMRAINRKEDTLFVESITGLSFLEVEKQYGILLKKEDTPIKKVNENYVIVNFEEAWEILNLSESELYFEKLTNALCEMLESMTASNAFSGSRLFERKMNSLFLNYIYFSSCISDSQMSIAINRILPYIYEKRIGQVILENLHLLAEACPKNVLEFLLEDIKKEESIILNCFSADKYNRDYCHILRTLEELMLVKETIVGAFSILIYLYDINREYAFSNKPEDSILSSLCLWRTEGTSSIIQKKELMLSLLKKRKTSYATLAIKLVNQDSYAVGVRLGERRVKGDPITYEELNSVRVEILDKAVEIAYEFGDGKLIKEMLEHFFFIRPEKLLTFAEQFKKESFNEESIHEINYWAREKLFSIRRFKWEEYKAYINPIETWIEKTKDSDETDASYWIFRKSYDCPAIELLKTCDNYKIESSARYEYQKDSFLSLVEKYGRNVLEKIVGYMSDENYWGRFLADVTSTDDFKYCVEVIAKANRIKILCAYLDCADVENSKEYVFARTEEEREVLLPNLTNNAIITELENEKELKSYWKTKQMIEYDEFTYSSLLKYYPENLIWFLSMNIEKDPAQYVVMAEEIFAAMIDSKETEIRQDLVDDLERIMSAIDSVYYSEEWAILCIKIYSLEYVSSFSESARKYLFDHPGEIKKLLECDNINQYTFLSTYKVPECAYLDYSTFRYFFIELRKLLNDESGYYIGSILGKTKNGEDGWFPHEFTRNILEEFNEKRMDEHVMIAYLNDMSFRTISDGSDQKAIMEKYKNKALELEIRYPHTAYILNLLSEDYGRNAKHDYEDSEINLF